MNQHTLLTDELKVQIRAAWGAGFQVSLGRPRIPFATAPYAMISVGKVPHSGSGRSSNREWQFEIFGVFPLEGEEDSETQSFAKIEELVQNLEPYTEPGEEVPPVDPPFAGISDQHYIADFGPMEEKMADDFFGCYVKFIVQTHIHA